MIEPKSIKVGMIVKYQSYGNSLCLIVMKLKTDSNERYEFNDANNPDRYMGGLRDTECLYKYNSIRN